MTRQKTKSIERLIELDFKRICDIPVMYIKEQGRRAVVYRGLDNKGLTRYIAINEGEAIQDHYFKELNKINPRV
jgi:hypothetical protein